MSESALELAKLKAQENEIISLISSNEDPVFEESLKFTLYENQTSQALLEGILTLEEQSAPSKLQNTLTGLMSLSNSLGVAVATSQDCIEKYPALIPAATTFLGSVGGVASAFGPAWGLAYLLGRIFLMS